MRLLLGIVGIAVAVGVAIPALADPADGPLPPDPAADANFIASLNKAGMTFRNGSDAVAAGRLACDMMNSGTSEQDVVNKLSMLNPGLSTAGAMKFAALASSNYCPEYLTKSSAKTGNSSPFPGLGGR
ncbi:DUF732 domain-containing protein [Mycobacterium sp.]